MSESQKESRLRVLRNSDIWCSGFKNKLKTQKQFGETTTLLPLLLLAASDDDDADNDENEVAQKVVNYSQFHHQNCDL